MSDVVADQWHLYTTATKAGVRYLAIDANTEYLNREEVDRLIADLQSVRDKLWPEAKS